MTTLNNKYKKKINPYILMKKPLVFKHVKIVFLIMLVTQDFNCHDDR